jgi:hypothetical protein
MKKVMIQALQRIAAGEDPIPLAEAALLTAPLLSIKALRQLLAEPHRVHLLFEIFLWIETPQGATYWMRRCHDGTPMSDEDWNYLRRVDAALKLLDDEKINSDGPALVPLADGTFKTQDGLDVSIT